MEILLEILLFQFLPSGSCSLKTWPSLEVNLSEEDKITTLPSNSALVTIDLNKITRITKEDWVKILESLQTFSTHASVPKSHKDLRRDRQRSWILWKLDGLSYEEIDQRWSEEKKEFMSEQTVRETLKRLNLTPRRKKAKFKISFDENGHFTKAIIS